jgi:predicted nucleic acid-binding protein
VTLVDTNILLDLVTEDPVWLARSRATLAGRLALGPVHLIDVVFAETSVRFITAADCAAFALALGLQRMPMRDDALWLAGQAFLAYRRHGGQRTNVLPEFFIGAQASVTGLPVLTRDPARMSSAFPGVKVLGLTG